MRTLSTRYRKPFLAFILIIACSFLLEGCEIQRGCPGAGRENGFLGFGDKAHTQAGAARHSF